MQSTGEAHGHRLCRAEVAPPRGVLPVLGPHHEEVTGAGVLHRQHVLPSTAPKTTDAPLTDDQRTVNLLHAATRAPAERGNSLLKTTFKALRRVGLCPWRIGAITAAALVLLHHQHGRTT
ncbi:MAG TPA: transposase family protein [Nocardioidaceae bacterium]|nr:transposase family protein [Nocardioidaceae bacterium]